MAILKTKENLIVIVSLIVFIALFLFVNPSEFINDLLSFSPILLFLIIILFIIDLSLRVIRWWIILHSQDMHVNVPFKALVKPTFSSSLLNLVLPGRLGEIVRLYALRDQYNVRYSVGLSVIVVEQVINMMSLILAGSIGLGLVFFAQIELNNDFLNDLIPYAFIGSLVLLGGVLILFIVDPKKFVRFFSFLPNSIFLKAERFLNTFSFGLQTIKGKFYIFWIAIFSSLTIWILEGIIIWIIAIEFISGNFEFPIAFFSSILGNLNFMIPILPGAAGQYELFIASILQLSPHYMNEKAIAVAFSDRLIKTGILLALGGYSTISIGYSKILSYRDEDPVSNKDK